jgi:hypothetical protein
LTSRRNIRMVYEAVRLAERFPDLPDVEVIDHIESVFGWNIVPDTTLERAILTAYKTQNENTGLWWLR